MSQQALYVAGPMTGLPRYNYDAFEAATVALRDAGYLVYSPHELDANLDLRGFDPDVPGSFTTDHRYTAMRADLDIVVNLATGIAVLDGWQDSKGATLEVAVAKAIGKPVGQVEEWITTAKAREALRRAYR